MRTTTYTHAVTELHPPYRNNQIGHFAQLSDTDLQRFTGRRVRGKRAVRQSGEPAQSTTYRRTSGDQAHPPYRNNQIGHFARMAWIQSRLRSTADPTEERSGDQESLPKLQGTPRIPVTKLILRIEIAKSGPSHGWLGYKVSSEAPQTRRRSAQTTRRACPNYNLHTCGDQAHPPYRNNQIGHFARMDWIQITLTGGA